MSAPQSPQQFRSTFVRLLTSRACRSRVANDRHAQSTADAIRNATGLPVNRQLALRRAAGNRGGRQRLTGLVEQRFDLAAIRRPAHAALPLPELTRDSGPSEHPLSGRVPVLHAIESVGTRAAPAPSTRAFLPSLPLKMVRHPCTAIHCDVALA